MPLGLSLLFACGPPAADQPRPSILLISLDTLRADRTGLAGYERDTTPYLDRLAAESVVYDEAYSVAPWTLISHMTMLTGLNPEQHGVVQGRAALSKEIPLVAEVLREAGYQTLGLYFEGWVHERHGFDRGFDVFEAHRDAEEAELHLAKWLPKLDPERPVFLFLHLFDVHTRGLDREDSTLYEPPEPYDRMFMEDARERLQGLTLPRAYRNNETLTEAQLEALGALYDGGVRYVDHKLERWIESWRRTGLLDDSLLIVTSDHGESLGQRGWLKGHGRMYQEGLHIPLLVRYPGARDAGRRSRTAVGLVDLAATIYAHARVDAPFELPGYRLDAEVPEQRVLVAQHDPYKAWLQAPWKVIVEGDGGQAYRLDDDPGESSPLLRGTPEYDELHSQLERQYSSELGARARIHPPPSQAPPMKRPNRRKLRALGYAGDEDE